MVSLFLTEWRSHGRSCNIICSAITPYHYSAWLYFTLLDSTTLYHASVWLYLIRGSTWFYLTTLYQGSSYITLLELSTPMMALLGFSWLYLILLNSTTLHHASTWLYFTLLDSTTVYHASAWLYLILLYSTTLYHGST